MNKTIARLLLVVIILVAVVISCVDLGRSERVVQDSSKNNQALPSLQATVSANITATFGAEQFHIQLTALAQPGQ